LLALIKAKLEKWVYLTLLLFQSWASWSG